MKRSLVLFGGLEGKVAANPKDLHDLHGSKALLVHWFVELAGGQGGSKVENHS